MKKIVYLILFISLSLPSFATHYMGGEIIWQCLPNGNYKFTLYLYRECYTQNGGAAATFGATEPLYTTVPGLPQITMTRITLLDMSPVCNVNFSPKIFCPGMLFGNANQGALQENYYTSDAAYPNGVTLNGVPPPQGWEFSSRTCCRNPCTNINSASSLGFRLRAYMYSYNGQNANPCFDNSPVFAEKPSTVICTGYPFTYNHNAYDPDLDSLVYEWGQPLEENGSPIVNYNAGYSYTSPLPGPTHNPNNVAATVNPFTGEISFTSYTQGAFVTVVKVTTFRCGQKIAEVFREIQVVLLACGNNFPPNVDAPFYNPGTGFYDLYVDTVFAGELVTFTINGADFELMPDNQTPQTMKILASGAQFGANFTNPNAGCLQPPCATLTPPPPVTAQFGVSTTFNWQTSCSHLATVYTNQSCPVTTNTYNFLIKVMDDFCPAPAIKFSTITVVVIDSLMKHPQPKCIATQPNGNIQITWEQPIMVNSFQVFDSYHIYYSPTQAGPFTVIDSIFNYNQTTWTHNTPNGNSQVGYYYIKSRSGCGKLFLNEPVDTINNILLTVSNPGNGVANLSWNPSKIPPIPTNSPMYLILRNPGTGFSVIDSTTSLNYFDTIVFCNQNVEYQIRQYDSTGCYSQSNIDGDVFSDVTPPDTPLLDYVTVDLATQKANLFWQSSNAPDAVGYIVYRFNGAVWSPLDTVTGLTYEDLTGTPDLNYEAYRIASIDSCGNTSPMGLEHRTIFLTTSKDICDDAITLNWTPYINLANSLASYEIQYNINGGAYQFLSSVGPNVTTFTHNGLTDSTEYCYYIKAINNDGTKTPASNFRCETALRPFQPQFAYIRYATVVENNYVKLLMHTDTSAKVTSYLIQRDINHNGTFSQIAVLPPSLNPTITHEDFQVDVEKNIYTYRFIVRDSCDFDAITSNDASTILLSGEQGTDVFSNLIQWSSYEGWPTGVTYYDVYRGTTNPFLSDFVAQVPVGSNSYLDIFPDDVMTSEGKISYYVTGFEAAGNPYGFAENSTSNIIFIPQPPRIYVPNAFTPGGNNPVFQPLLLFVDQQNYYFAVFNRWGQEMFSTTDITKGWDGKFKGNYVKGDMYTWILKAKFANGILFEKRGVVTVLR